MPPLPAAPAVGQDCQVFGGSISLASVTISGYIYLFTVGPVGVKLYVAEGRSGQLSLDLVHRIAEKAAARIQPDRIDAGTQVLPALDAEDKSCPSCGHH